MEGIVMQVLEQELTETLKVWSTISKVLSTLHIDEQYNKDKYNQLTSECSLPQKSQQLFFTLMQSI